MFQYKKIPYFNMLPIIILSLLFYKIINNIDVLKPILDKVLSILAYPIWGFCIAYFLNPFMVYLEEKLKFKRIFSLLVVYLLFIFLLILIILLVLPTMIRSIMDLITNLNMPNIITNTQSYIDSTLMKNKFIASLGINTSNITQLNSYVSQLSSILSKSINIVVGQLINITNLMIRISTGIIISIYLLLEKEKCILAIKHFLYAFLSTKTCNQIIHFGKTANLIFKQYFIGKSIDSFIIGVLCFTATTILGIHYALLISIVIGITNLIPYFGNFIGLVPAFIITFFFSPIMAFQLTVIVLVLSTLDGWLLAPMIIGDKIGLSPLWIILAIMAGGSLYGVVGMFLAVPVMALIKTFLEEIIRRKIDEKSSDI
ncbi:MAG TPA: AI-2E family transporter [Clostridiaceae bacterium]